MVNAVPPQNILSQYPGRKYLFDVGSSYYSSSMAWLVERYARHGVHFDELWAWEATPTVAVRPETYLHHF